MTNSLPWHPVVYGRTSRADFWWRAVPAGVPKDGWLSEVVQATVAGGSALDRPRFVLGRRGEATVVGVACRAAALSETMNQHERRDLYCFVGWWSAARTVTGPTHAELAAHWAEWAAPVYEEWVGHDWTRHPSEVREPRPSPGAAAPWPAPEQAPGGGDRFYPAASPYDVFHAPPAMAAHLWDRALAEPVDFLFVTGWARAASARHDSITHLGADDVEVENGIWRRRPEPPPPMPDPASRPGKPPVRGSRRDSPARDHPTGAYPPVGSPPDRQARARAGNPIGFGLLDLIDSVKDSFVDGLRGRGERDRDGIQLVRGGAEHYDLGEVGATPAEAARSKPTDAARSKPADGGGSTPAEATRPAPHQRREGPVEGREREVDHKQADYSAYFDDED